MTSNGQSFPYAVYIQAVGATLQLIDALSAPISALVVYNGTFIDAGFSVTATRLVSNVANTRTITKTGNWTLNASTAVNVLDLGVGGATLTWSDTAGTITISDTGNNAKTFAGAGKTFNNLTIAGGGTGAIIFTGANSFNDFTIGRPKTVTLPASTITTIRGTFTSIGDASNVITLNSSTGGTKATLDLDGSAYVTRTNATDISGTGTAVTDYGGTLSNTDNWTADGTTAVWTASANGDWSTAGNWSTNSAPGTTTDVKASDSYSSKNITLSSTDNARDLDFTGYTGTLTHNTGTTLNIYGSLTLASGMTYTPASSTSILNFAATTTGKTITLNGKTLNSLAFDGVGGGWTLQDTNVTLNNNLTISNGTLTSCTGNLSIAGNWTNNGNFTHNSGTVILNGTNQAINGSTTFNNLSKTESTDNSTDVTLTFDNTGTQTIAGLLTLDGLDANDRINLVSDSTGDQWSLTANGTFAIDYVDVRDSNASAVISHTNSISSGNTRNWFPASYLKITGTATMTAGGTNELTLTAYDANGTVTDEYTGSKSLTFSGLTAGTVEGTNLGSATSIAFTSGISNSNVATLIPTKAESASLDVTDGTVSSTSNASYDLDLGVNAGAVSNFLVEAPATADVDVAFSTTITARDQYNNTTTNVSGSTTLSADQFGIVTPATISQANFTDDGVYADNLIISNIFPA